jgi:hypothetical protein
MSDNTWEENAKRWHKEAQRRGQELDELRRTFLSHDDLCYLSRLFNGVAHLGKDRDYRINEWLKRQIATTASG